ncbi:MAG: hypothetical protein H6732_07735 [Alphaproteobacteria bacterium]|nr:hypothetical protein [Alphaproteobacteria bacterium]
MRSRPLSTALLLALSGAACDAEVGPYRTCGLPASLSPAERASLVDEAASSIERDQTLHLVAPGEGLDAAVVAASLGTLVLDLDAGDDISACPGSVALPLTGTATSPAGSCTLDAPGSYIRARGDLADLSWQGACGAGDDALVSDALHDALVALALESRFGALSVERVEPGAFSLLGHADEVWVGWTTRRHMADTEELRGVEVGSTFQVAVMRPEEGP